MPWIVADSSGNGPKTDIASGGTSPMSTGSAHDGAEGLRRRNERGVTAPKTDRADRTIGHRPKSAARTTRNVPPENFTPCLLATVFIPVLRATVTWRIALLRRHPWEAHQSMVAFGWPSSIEGPPLRDFLTLWPGNVKRKKEKMREFSDACHGAGNSGCRDIRFDHCGGPGIACKRTRKRRSIWPKRPRVMRRICASTTSPSATFSIWRENS